MEPGGVSPGINHFFFQSWRYAFFSFLFFSFLFFSFLSFFLSIFLSFFFLSFFLFSFLSFFLSFFLCFILFFFFFLENQQCEKRFSIVFWSLFSPLRGQFFAIFFLATRKKWAQGVRPSGKCESTKAYLCTRLCETNLYLFIYLFICFSLFFNFFLFYLFIYFLWGLRYNL